MVNNQPEPVSIVTVDIRRFIDTKKKQSCQSIGTNDDENQIPPNPPLAKGGRGDFQKKDLLLSEDAEDRLKEFSRSLYMAIERAGDGRIVIITDMV